MPPIAKHQSKETTKLLLIGDSSAGKTGALASLAARGYKLRIIDLDNGLDILKNYLTDPNSPYYKENPKAAENVEYVTLTDSYKNINGTLVPTKATVWQGCMKLLGKWQYYVTKEGKLVIGPSPNPLPEGAQAYDYGNVLEWGSDTILVIDSLSMLSSAALNFHLSLNAALNNIRTQNEARRDMGAAQNHIRAFLTMLYDESVRCNIIVTSHVTMVSEAGGSPKIEEGKFDSTPTGYPSAIGRALSPHIPRWFNSMLVVRSIGSGPSAKRKIYTNSQNLGNMVLSAKTSAPLKVKPEYDIAWGLADYMKDVQS